MFESLKVFHRKLFKKNYLLNGDPELVYRVQKLLATDLTIPQIVAKLEYIRTISKEEFNELFV